MELSGFDEDKLATIYKTVYWPATKVFFNVRDLSGKRLESWWSFLQRRGIRQVYYLQ
jgi:hypothetical protein